MRAKKVFKSVAWIVLIFVILLNLFFIRQVYVFTHFSGKKIPKQEHTSTFQKKFDRIVGEQHPKQLVVDSLSVPHQSLFIQSGNLKLAVWYLQHSKDSVARGTVIMFHGYESSRSEVIPEATAFYKMQFNVFMIDFRGHGQSEGNVCSMGYFEAGDVIAAYNFIKNKGEKNIILWGGSMGAAAVTKAMHDDNEIKPSKVILEKCYGQMTDAVRGFAKNSMHEPNLLVIKMLTFWGSVEQGIWMFNMKPDQFVKSISCPALIQWGDHDENVTKKETESIFKNIGSSQKQLVVYPGCGHENLLLKDPALWLKSVSNFLNS